MLDNLSMVMHFDIVLIVLLTCLVIRYIRKYLHEKSEEAHYDSKVNILNVITIFAFLGLLLSSSIFGDKRTDLFFKGAMTIIVTISSHITTKIKLRILEAKAVTDKEKLEVENENIWIYWGTFFYCFIGISLILFSI